MDYCDNAKNCKKTWANCQWCEFDPWKKEGDDEIMDEEKLREILKKAEVYMEGMNDFERETYLRALLMEEFSTGEL